MKRTWKALVSRHRVDDGRGFRLSKVDPADTAGFGSKDEAREGLALLVERLGRLQEKLYATDRFAVLVLFQGMDASGKDAAIEHVMAGVNPQGCEVHSFKAPSEEELHHDFLWRTTCRLPRRGDLGIFNRSYYEEVLVVRVHPELLERQRLPRELAGKNLWEERFEDINAFERHLTRSGTRVLKFFLHLSPAEQKKRFLSRLDTPEKRWKFAMGDVDERASWKRYMAAYEKAIRQTSTRWAPWHVIPADRKWFAHLAIAAALVETLEGLDLRFPKETPERRAELARARTRLEKSSPGGPGHGARVTVPE